jgi:hypothetical protein
MLVEHLRRRGVDVEAFDRDRDLFDAQEVLLVAPRDQLLDFFYRDDPLECRLLTSGPMIGRGSRLPVLRIWLSPVVSNDCS